MHNILYFSSTQSAQSKRNHNNRICRRFWDQRKNTETFLIEYFSRYNAICLRILINEIKNILFLYSYPVILNQINKKFINIWQFCYLGSDFSLDSVILFSFWQLKKNTLTQKIIAHIQSHLQSYNRRCSLYEKKKKMHDELVTFNRMMSSFSGEFSL